MAIRQIRVMGDEVLNKRAKEVKEMTPRIKELINDMIDTMRDANGVGLAAPQVGILKRIAVIEVEEGKVFVFINPNITETKGEQIGYEGCLSVPGKTGVVKRPDIVKVEALDENMQPYTIEAQGLFARAICHECAHLDGELYVNLVDGELMNTDDLEYEYEEEEE